MQKDVYEILSYFTYHKLQKSETSCTQLNSHYYQLGTLTVERCSSLSKQNWTGNKAYQCLVEQFAHWKKLPAVRNNKHMRVRKMSLLDHSNHHIQRD